MNSNDRFECLSCGWRGEAYEVKHVTIKLQATPVDLEEKACPNCGSIAVEKVSQRRKNRLL